MGIKPKVITKQISDSIKWFTITISFTLVAQREISTKDSVFDSLIIHFAAIKARFTEESIMRYGFRVVVKWFICRGLTMVLMKMCSMKLKKGKMAFY